MRQPTSSVSQSSVILLCLFFVALLAHVLALTSTSGCASSPAARINDPAGACATIIAALPEIQRQADEVGMSRADFAQQACDGALFVAKIAKAKVDDAGADLPAVVHQAGATAQ